MIRTDINHHSLEPILDTNRKAILDAAQIMIERFGSRALIEVDTRIEELTAKNQHQALVLWVEIRKEIKCRMPPKPDSKLH